MDAAIEERVVQKENELNATYDERMRNYEERFATDMLCVSNLTLILRSLQRTGLAASSLSLEGSAS
jgi:hypothetical protein